MTTKALYPATKPSLLLDFAQTKELDPRITFTRTTEARYYDGKTVAKAEENLLLRSQEFNVSPWAAGGAAVTANTEVAPDGTSTAETVTENNANTVHEIYQVFSSTTGLPYTWSGYVKANGRTKVRFRCFATAVIYDVNYDLTAVTTTNIGGTGTATITDAGNGWYRITATATSTASGTGYWQLNLLDGSSNIVYTGDGTSGVYIWGAQLEQRSSVTAYTPTTTQPITNYIPVLQTAAAGQARFDHNPVTGESLGLLIEEQRANLLQRSDDFANAYWTKTNSSIESNTVVAPDGTLTGDRLVEDTTASSNHFVVSTTITPTSGVTYTFTVYAKAAQRTWMAMQGDNAGLNGRAFFNLANGTIGTVASGTTASITSVGNGWYRCSFTRTAQAAFATGFVVQPASADNTNSYTGDGYSGIYIWGAQLEAGAFPTSYIPTVASQVTRNADAASMTGTNFSSWYRADEGTLYGEVVPNTPTNNSVGQVFVDINSGTTNRMRSFRRAGSNLNTFAVTSSNVNEVTDLGTTLLLQGVSSKTIATYKVNDFATTANADTVSTDISGILPVVDNMLIGNNVTNNGVLNGTIKKLAFYPARLTNAQLQSITTV
jgi:hypothetical protein